MRRVATSASPTRWQGKDRTSSSSPDRCLTWSWAGRRRRPRRSTGGCRVSRAWSPSTSAAWDSPTGAPSFPTLEQRMDDVRAVMDGQAVRGHRWSACRREGRWRCCSPPATPSGSRTRPVVDVRALGLGARLPARSRPEGGGKFCDHIEASWGHGRVWPLISTNDSHDDEATHRRLGAFRAKRGDTRDGGGCQSLWPAG